MNAEFLLLTLIVPPAIEAAIVDWLLEIVPGSGFTSFPASGHSSRHAGLSVGEQVTGRRRQIRFELHLPAEAMGDIVDRLKADFAGIGLHYWISPIVTHGRI